MLDRPEVVEVITPVDASMDSDSKKERVDRGSHLMMWFTEYLGHKYGDDTEAVFAAQVYASKFIAGLYSSLEDLKLDEDLLAEMYVCRDDGETYS